MIPVPSTSDGSQLLAWLTVILEENHTTWSRTTERVIAAPVETQSGTTERVFVIPVETQNYFCLNYKDFVNLVKHLLTI